MYQGTRELSGRNGHELEQQTEPDGLHPYHRELDWFLDIHSNTRMEQGKDQRVEGEVPERSDGNGQDVHHGKTREETALCRFGR